MILSKIIPSISTTAFTALRVTGLLEPIKPIKMKTLGEHAKYRKTLGLKKKKGKGDRVNHCSAVSPLTVFNYFSFLSLFAHFLRSSIIGEKRVLVKERNSKTKEIMRETMQ